jgi:hypothetical protein
MGGACSMHGADEKRKQNLKERDNSGNLGVDGRIILTWISQERVQTEQTIIGVRIYFLPKPR